MKNPGKRLLCLALAFCCAAALLAGPACADEQAIRPEPSGSYCRVGGTLTPEPVYEIDGVQYASVGSFFLPLCQQMHYDEDHTVLEVSYCDTAYRFSGNDGTLLYGGPEAGWSPYEGAAVLALYDENGVPDVYAPMELLLELTGLKAIPYSREEAHTSLDMENGLPDVLLVLDDTPWGSVNWEQLEYLQSFSAVLLTSHAWDDARAPSLELAVELYLCDGYYPITGYGILPVWNEAAGQVLSVSWNCQSRAEVLDTLDWLLTQGHRYDFWNDAPQMPDWFKEKWGDTYPAHALLGWDLARAVSVAQWACCCGYLTQQEALGYELAAAQALQQTFDGWEAFFNDYMMGYDYWGGQDQHLTTEGRRREEIYQTLFADGSFRGVAWDQALPAQADAFSPREAVAPVPDWWFGAPVDENGYVSFGPEGYHAYYGTVTAPGGGSQPAVSAGLQDALALFLWFGFPLLAFLIAWAFSRRSRLKPVPAKPAAPADAPQPAFVPSTYAYYPERPGAKDPDRPLPPRDHFLHNRILTVSALICGVVGLYLPLYGVLPGTAAILLALPVRRKGRDHYGKAAAATVLGACTWIQFLLFLILFSV